MYQLKTNSENVELEVQLAILSAWEDILIYILKSQERDIAADQFSNPNKGW